MAAVGADDEIRAHLEQSLGGRRADAGDPPAVFHQLGRLRPHAQPKLRIPPGVLGEEIQKIPLRHEGEELQRVGRWVKSATGSSVADVRADLPRFLVRQPQQELVEQPELVHDLQGRRMNRVAAKVAQKVGVLFQHETSTPARASNRPSIMPAGPPPATQQLIEMLSVANASLREFRAGRRSAGSAVRSMPPRFDERRAPSRRHHARPVVRSSHAAERPQRALVASTKAGVSAPRRRPSTP